MYVCVTTTTNNNLYGFLNIHGVISPISHHLLSLPPSPTLQGFPSSFLFFQITIIPPSPVFLISTFLFPVAAKSYGLPVLLLFS